MRVVGIDTSLRSTGVGVVEAVGTQLKMVTVATLRFPARVPVSRCLSGLQEGLRDLIEETRPDAAAIEGVFYCRNLRTAVVLGQARGVALAVCAAAGLPIYEYAPRRVKQAVVGYGNAGKEQVRKMIMTLLALREEPQEDAGDALAMAVCHLHNQTRHAVLAPKAI